jgi:catechol 2,3-dioxygenase-like lactoylglutathione lyase family enzyme
MLPHCVTESDWHGPNGVFERVLRNSLATHGHPRALVGALTYAYSLWVTFRQNESFAYGQIIEMVRNELSTWTFDQARPVFANMEVELDRSYGEKWTSARMETEALLMVSADAMKAGAVHVDQETLKRLGAFSKENGSGTVSAASAIYLASRYAADPIRGILEAAFAKGADTDTLASMTGGIVGALAEGFTLQSYVEDLQDREFLKSLALQLCEKQETSVERTLFNGLVQRASLVQWVDSLDKLKLRSKLTLPDARVGSLVAKERLDSIASITVDRFTVRAADGQTLYFKRIRRGADVSHDRPKRKSEPAGLTAGFTPQSTLLDRVALKCVNLARTVSFYTDLLGLRVSFDPRPQRQFVILEHWMALAQDTAGAKAQNGSAISIVLRTSNLPALAQRINSNGITISRHEADYLECLDPDGRAVTVTDAGP